MTIKVPHLRALAAAITVLGAVCGIQRAALADPYGYTSGESCVGGDQTTRQKLDFNANGIVNTNTGGSAWLLCPITIEDYNTTSFDFGSASIYYFSHNTTAMTCTYKARATTTSVYYTAVANTGTTTGYSYLTTGSLPGGAFAPASTWVQCTLPAASAAGQSSVLGVAFNSWYAN